MQDQQPQKPNRSATTYHALLLAPTGAMYFISLLLGFTLIDRFSGAISLGITDYLLMAGIYAIGFGIYCYFFTGKNFHGVRIEAEGIRIVNKLPGFRHNAQFSMQEIEEIVFIQKGNDIERPGIADLFRELWLYPERKWVEIRTAERSYRFNCYGIAADFADFPLPSPEASYAQLFESLRDEYSLPVRWNGQQAA